MPEQHPEHPTASRARRRSVRTSAPACSRRHPSPALAVSIVALVFALGGVADAATGGTFILGQTNTASSETRLTADADASGLWVKNLNTGPSATGLRVTVATGHAPLAVSSTTRVKNLNADLVDGIQGAALQRRVTGTCPDTSSVQGINSDGTVVCEETAALAQFAAEAGTADFALNADVANYAYNADTLDSHDSGDFVFGPGQTFKGASAIPPGLGFAAIFLDVHVPELVVAYFCPSDLATNGTLVLRNDSSETVNVFSDNGGSNPEYRSLTSGAQWNQLASLAGEHVTFQVQGSQITTLEIFSVHRPASNDCHAEGQAFVSR